MTEKEQLHPQNVLSAKDDMWIPNRPRKSLKGTDGKKLFKIGKEKSDEKSTGFPVGNGDFRIRPDGNPVFCRSRPGQCLNGEREPEASLNERLNQTIDQRFAKEIKTNAGEDVRRDVPRNPGMIRVLEIH